MENAGNCIKRMADPKLDCSPEKRKRVGDDFWDHDWKCMNTNSEWSDDENYCIKRAENSKRI